MSQEQTVEPTPHTHKPKNNRRLYIAGLVLLVTIAAVVLVLRPDDSKQTAVQSGVFTINGKQYSRSEVDALIKYPTARGTAADQAAQQVFEYLKKQTAAKELGIEPSAQNIDAAKKTIFQADADNPVYKVDPWVELAAYSLAVDSLVTQNANNGLFKGYSFVFRFGERLEKGDDYTPPGYNNVTLIAQDRAYAEERAKYYLDKLKNNQLTPDQALAEIKQDAKLGYANKSGTNLSSRFGATNKGWSQEVFYPSIIDFIKTQAKPGLSDIQVGKTALVTRPQTESDYAETIFYFILLESGQSGDLKSKLNDGLAKLNAQYKGL